MSADHAKLLGDMLDSMSSLPFIEPENIPAIDLYMDQVTTFMEEHLSCTRRNGDDKIMTKTMINNYAKNHLLPAPVRKKYDRGHMLILTFIYYFKNVLSLQDIRSVLDPICRRYFDGTEELDIEMIYKASFENTPEALEQIRSQTLEECRRAAQQSAGLTGEDREFLDFFLIVSHLAMDIYVRKQLIEKLIDDYTSREE